jgi:hypothetical protein
MNLITTPRILAFDRCNCSIMFFAAVYVILPGAITINTPSTNGAEYYSIGHSQYRWTINDQYVIIRFDLLDQALHFYRGEDF